MTNKNMANQAAKITAAATIIAAIIGGIATILNGILEANNTSKTPIATPSKKSTPSISKTSSPNLQNSPIPTPTPTKILPKITVIEEYLRSCTDESKKFDESQCKQVLETLKDNFPQIVPNDISWKFFPKVYNCGDVKEIIEAVFKIDNERVNVEFDSKANLLEIEYEYKPIVTLPEKVKISLKNYLDKKNYPKFDTFKYYELEKEPNTNKLFYEFEINKKLDYDVTFDEDGNQVQNKCED